jgi:hypothetical protein
VRLCDADRALGLPYVEVVPPDAARTADVVIKRSGHAPARPHRVGRRVPAFRFFTGFNSPFL